MIGGMERDDAERPGYYAVIPAEVRYDPSLSQSAKIFYGEVSALTDMKGFCWAGNAYFCRLYGVQERQIRRWLVELAEAGHVKVTLADGGTRRLIRIADRLLEDGLRKTSPGRSKKTGGAVKKDRHISTNISTDAFMLSSAPEAPRSKARPYDVEEVVRLCREIGLTDEDARYYWNKWVGNGFKNGGRAMLDWRATIRSAEAAGYAPSQRKRNYGNNTKREGARADQHHDRRRHVEDPAEGGGGGLPSI